MNDGKEVTQPTNSSHANGKPIQPWGIFGTYYQYHFSQGDSKEESRRIYSVAPELTEFK